MMGSQMGQGACSRLHALVAHLAAYWHKVSGTYLWHLLDSLINDVLYLVKVCQCIEPSLLYRCIHVS